MEAKLENILDSMMENEGTVGALFADSQGLCYGSKFKLLQKNLLLNYICIVISSRKSISQCIRSDNIHCGPSCKTSSQLKRSSRDTRKC